MKQFLYAAATIFAAASLLIVSLAVDASDNRDALAAAYSDPEYKYDANGWMDRNLMITPVIFESSERHEARCTKLIQEIGEDAQLEENLRASGFGSVSCADQVVKF